MTREQAINYLISSGFSEEQINEIAKAFEPTTKNDLAVREFEEIEVIYPPEELCTYPEYKGKPYFGIKYRENGEEIVGYGTYKPKVLSQYLKDYFISTNKNDLAVDAVSRQSVLDLIADYDLGMGQVVKGIHALPSVKPQEPKTGYWIDDKCSVCGKGTEDLISSPEWYRNEEPNFCPFCGVKLESEK